MRGDIAALFAETEGEGWFEEVEGQGGVYA
jgi:hypothetical protein